MIVPRMCQHKLSSSYATTLLDSTSSMDIHERNIDIFLGQETNRPTRTQQFQATKQYLRKHKQHIVTAETKWTFQSAKKPGGTFCITNKTMRHMITQKIIDHMGRWARNVYQLQGIQIAIISIYQTVQTSHLGFTSIHAQQVAILKIYYQT
jgi:hypothetical protein